MFFRRPVRTVDDAVSRFLGVIRDLKGFMEFNSGYMTGLTNQITTLTEMHDSALAEHNRATRIINKLEEIFGREDGTVPKG